MKKREFLGYGAATIADSGPYNFVTIYLILFLTTVVGLSPEKAAVITSIGILSDGIISALIGYISDHTKSKYGRRRPYLLASILPFGIGLVLMFTVFNFTTPILITIYITVAIVFWFGFGIYYTPYTALGAELTNDYNERGTLRTYARIYGITGNFIGMVVPLYLIQTLQDKGLSEQNSWTIMAAIIAILACTGIIITWRSTRGKEKCFKQESTSVGIISLIREYVSILKLKPFKHMVIVLAFYTLANTFYNSGIVFFARYSLGIKDEITSVVFMISIITNIIYTPIAGICSNKLEKKNILAVSMLISGAGGLFFYFTEIMNFWGMVIYVCIYSLSYSCFWQFITAIIYDISEVGEYVLGKRLEGSISSVYSLVLTFSAALATQIFGWILKLGYINESFLLLPGIFLLIAGIAQYKYPLNKKAFNQLKKALEDNKNGIEPDIRSLNRII